MKIVIINGSPRSDGITARILHTIEAQLQKLDVEVVYFNLRDLNISQCTGCCSCSGKNRYFLQTIYNAFIFNIGIKPFVKSKKEAYTGVAERWRSRK